MAKKKKNAQNVKKGGKKTKTWKPHAPSGSHIMSIASGFSVASIGRWKGRVEGRGSGFRVSPPVPGEFISHGARQVWTQ